MQYLVEFVDVRIRAIDNIDKSLIRNNYQSGIFLWQSADESGSVREGNRG